MSFKVVDKDHGWKRMFQMARSLAGGAYAKVGILDDDKGGAQHGEGGDLTVAQIAVVNEFGTEDGKIPARSFVRATFDEQSANLQIMAHALLIQCFFGTNNMTVERALNILGAQLAAEIKKKVTTGAGVPPPNAPSTALRKASKGKTKKIMGKEAKTLGDAMAQAGALASVRTLVDTGRMINAVTWAVQMNGKG